MTSSASEPETPEQAEGGAGVDNDTGASASADPGLELTEPEPAVPNPAVPDPAVPNPEPDPAVPDPEPDAAPDPAAQQELTTQLAERTADLQRLQAEYVNYKRRVDRDRDMVRGIATVGVLTALIPVLDDVDRARSHGELTGGFKAVAESLERVVAALGLARFGEPGEPFDPRVHEALTSEVSDEVVITTALAILQPGYRVGDRIVRPARVAVAEPAGDGPVPDEQPAE